LNKFFSSLEEKMETAIINGHKIWFFKEKFYRNHDLPVFIGIHDASFAWINKRVFNLPNEIDEDGTKYWLSINNFSKRLFSNGTIVYEKIE